MKYWMFALLAACGDSFFLADARLGDDVPLFPDTPVCAAEVCGGVCVDLATDPTHCGLCTRACPSNLPSCVQGNCQLADQTISAIHFGGANAGNAVAGVVTDASGNLYVTGTMVGTVDLGGGAATSAGAGDIFVASYTSIGGYRWSKVFGNAGADAGAGIAIGDRVYVAANFTGTVNFAGTMLTSAGATDIAELELDSSTGDLFVARRFGTPNRDTAYGIAWTIANQVALVGSFGQGNLDLDGMTLVGASPETGFLVTFDLGGSPMWARQLAVDATSTSACRAVAADQSGNVIVGGGFAGVADFGFGQVAASGTDAFVASFSSFGTQTGVPGSPNWFHTFGAADNDTTNAVAVDPMGDVYAGGSYHGNVDFGIGAIPSRGTLDGFVVGYTQQGVLQFARHLGAATRSTVNGVAASNTGTVVATGILEGTADFGSGPLAPLGQADIFVAGFGGVAPTFARRFGGADLDSGTAVGAGPGGYFTFGGVFRGTVDLGTGNLAGGAADNGYVIVIAP